MKIGTSTRAVWNHETIDAIELLRKIGYDEVELWVEYPRFSLDLVGSKDIDALKNVLHEFKMDISIHAPIRDINISSLNYGCRREAVRQIKDTICFAEEIGSEIVILHPGKNTSKKDPFEDTEKLFYESLNEIVKCAEQYGVTVALENMEKKAGEFILTADEILTVLKKINSPKLKICFDIAHANTITDDLVAYYDKIKDYVVHAHISDNDGFGSKTHMKMGEGSIDFMNILSVMHKNGYNGFLTIEGYRPGETEVTVSDNYRYLKTVVDEIVLTDLPPH